MKHLCAAILLVFFSLCAFAQQPQPPAQAVEKPADIPQNEWNSGGQLYFIGRLFLDKDPQAPDIENLILQTRIGFKILLRAGIEQELKAKLASLGDKEINLCLYFFSQKVTLNKYSNVYDDKDTLQKINKSTMELDGWAIPLFIFKVYDPLEMAAPAYKASVLTSADEEFLSLSRKKPLLVTGKVNGVVRSTNLKPRVASLASMEVTVEKPESVKAQVIGLFVTPDCKVTRRSSDGKNVQVVADAIQVKDKVEVWYEVLGLKKIALAVIINE